MNPIQKLLRQCARRKKVKGPVDLNKIFKLVRELKEARKKDKP